MYDDDDFAPLATMSQSVDEWARNVGWYDRYKDSQWLSHDYDVWVRNPHYVGPEQPHPEEDNYCGEDDGEYTGPEETPESLARFQRNASEIFDDIPF
jgi:hypothetical protein